MNRIIKPIIESLRRIESAHESYISDLLVALNSLTISEASKYRLCYLAETFIRQSDSMTDAKKSLLNSLDLIQEVSHVD